ncbi:MAG: hypothetical protein PHC34_04580 [Candidatus Gastranaerophilales bacterium]|nr:hypothetical protein [Candidatus Gastranaerophilales bacterium]
MEQSLYDPYLEAKVSGIKVRFICFKKINSLLVQSVVYLRKSMNKIEKRCRLTYELVHYSRGHLTLTGLCEGHTAQEEDKIRQETANRLIKGTKLCFLIESCISMDKIAEELQVTKDVIYDYFKYCKVKPFDDLKSIKRHSSVVVCKVSAGSY